MSFDNIVNINKPELLAPAGNIQSFYAVLNAGADAVYMAGNRFGARAFADNFSDEELIGCIRYAHLYNKKIYLTVNTLIKNDEKGFFGAFSKTGKNSAEILGNVRQKDRLLNPQKYKAYFLVSLYVAKYLHQY